MTTAHIIDATGSSNRGALVNESGALLVALSNTSSSQVITGSVAITNADISVNVTVADYISVTPSGTFHATVSGAGNFSVTGSTVWKQVHPNDSSLTNPAFTLNYSGNNISRLNMFIAGSEYRKNFTVNVSGLITSVGSWVKQ